MPIKHAAEKALRGAKKAAARNRVVKDRIKKLIKIGVRAATAGKLNEARALVSQIAQTVDKAARRSIIKQNKANRIKSRYAALLKKTSGKK